MKKEICILSNGLARGGTDTFVINLVKGLDKTKYNTDELVETGRLVFKNNCIQIEGFSNEANQVFQAEILETYPARIADVYSIKVAAEKGRLN